MNHQRCDVRYRLFDVGFVCAHKSRQRNLFIVDGQLWPLSISASNQHDDETFTKIVGAAREAKAQNSNTIFPTFRIKSIASSTCCGFVSSTAAALAALNPIVLPCTGWREDPLVNTSRRKLTARGLRPKLHLQLRKRAAICQAYTALYIMGQNKYEFLPIPPPLPV